MTQEAGKSEPMLYPLSLEFFSDDDRSWQPEMHLYNPYEHALKFKVFTTAPNKYTVRVPEGSVQPGGSTNLLVMHLASAFSDKNTTDKLRFKFFIDGNMVHKRDIQLHSIVDRREYIMSQMMTKASSSFSTHSNESSDDKYLNTSFAYGNSLPDMIAMQHKSRTSNKDIKNINNTNVRQKFYADQIALYNGENVNYLVILIGLFCLTILFLPNYLPDAATKNVSQTFPAYLHVSYEIKLFCSFILGMVTMVILKN